MSSGNRVQFVVPHKEGEIFPGTISTWDRRIHELYIIFIFVYFLSISPFLIEGDWDIIKLVTLIFLVSIPLTLFVLWNFIHYLFFFHRFWRKRFYFFSIPYQWPIRDMTSLMLANLARKGFIAQLTTQQKRIFKNPKHDDAIVWGYSINPGNRSMFIVSTYDYHFILDLFILKRPVYNIVILPISERFDKKQDPLVMSIGEFLLHYQDFIDKHL